MADRGDLYRMEGIGEICVGVQTNYVCPFHTHDTYSIGIFRGPALIVCRGSAWKVDSGDIVLLEPNEPHRGTSMSRTCLQDGILPDSAFLTAMFGTPNPLRFPRPVVRDPTLAQRLSHAAASRDREATRALLGRLFECYAQVEPPLDVPKAAAKPGFPAGGTASSQGEGISRWRFARRLRRETGLSPRDLRRQLRVAYARRLIEKGETLAEAALRAGFSDQAHMTRQLRSLLGVTPAALRRSRRGA
ncbi:MAG TPA: AraC family transcriptional regulator [Allosphingosinicella sp.]|jgi:hypothetical protein|nr:AraC family transcriptional regulator [Allosphingosinicella sp.]